MHFRMCRAILDLYPLVARNTSPCSFDSHKYLCMLPNVPWEAKSTQLRIIHYLLGFQEQYPMGAHYDIKERIEEYWDFLIKPSAKTPFSYPRQESLDLSLPSPKFPVLFGRIGLLWGALRIVLIT